MIVAVLLFPVYWMLLTSLRSEADAAHSPPLLAPHAPADRRLLGAAVFDNPDVKQAIVNSVIISVGTMLLTLLLAVPAAYVLARRRVRFVGLALLILLVTQLLPGIAVATPLFVIFKHLGLLNSYLGLILADATLTVPFAILILRPFFLRDPARPGVGGDGRRLPAAGRVPAHRPAGVAPRRDHRRRAVVPARLGRVPVRAVADDVHRRAAADRRAGQIQLEHRDAVEPGDGGRDAWSRCRSSLVFIGLQRYIVGGLTLGGIKE